jgi:hypothetical protein
VAELQLCSPLWTNIPEGSFHALASFSRLIESASSLTHAAPRISSSCASEVALAIGAVRAETSTPSDVPTRRRISTRLPSRPLRAAGSHRYSKDADMQNGRKTPRHSNPGPPSTSRPIRWTPNTDRPKPNGFGSAQRSYERYLALAQEEVRCGNIVAAENYYQHAEHYYRSMSGDRGGAS